MSTVELVLSLCIPGMVIGLVALGVYELKVRKRPGTPLSATYINEFTAMFYGSKRMELDHRDSMSMLREEDAEGAPPGPRVDMDRGIVILRPEEPGGPGRA